MKRFPERILFCIVVSLLLFLPAGPLANASLARKVSAGLAYWDQARGFQDIQNNVSVFSEISPYWYTLDPAGDVLPYANASGVPYVSSTIVSYLHANNILAIPTIANALNGTWNGTLVDQLLANSSTVAAHIANTVNMVIGGGYDGVDIDYEDLSSADRAEFSSFITDLAAALHAKGKLLTVEVYPKTSEPGTTATAQAEDWSAIGAAADEVRIMAYNDSWSTSPPGPVAPVSWVGGVLAFAVTEIPPAKVILGIPTFGYDWPSGSAGTEYVWGSFISIANANGAAINWNATSASPWFTYAASGVTHTDWFENASSADAKFALTNQYNLGGISVWRLGGEDPGVWAAAAARFASSTASAPPPDTQPPTVAITSPAAGATLQRNNQQIAVSASDDVGVAKVLIYGDATLLATDTAPPYAATWNVRKLASGAHTIKAVAYDAAGNSASAEITVYKK